MTYKTHRAFAIGWVLIGNMLLYTRDITHLNYYLALLITLQFGKIGALFPDVDHHWESVKEKTVPNRIINTIIRVTGGKHRSRHTHSWDIAIISLIGGIYLLHSMPMTELNREVSLVILLGFIMGWFSHLFSDMLTSGGTYPSCISRNKIKLVPRKIGSLVFNTGNEWEEFVYKVTQLINKVIGVVAIMYPLIYQNKEIIMNTIGG